MSKLRFERERKRKPGKNIGYYIALGLCLSAVGITGWSMLGNKSEPELKPEEIVESQYEGDNWDMIADEVDNIVNDVPDLTSEIEAESAPQEAQEANTAPEEAPESSKEEKGPVMYTMPVTGKLHKSFSGTELIYSQTLEDWRVHEGVDILASKGDKIKSAAGGQVLDVVEDTLLGMTVIIRHEEGLTAYYSGLSSKVLVSKDQKIEAGAVLGTIDVVPCELVDPPHLHFAVKKDGAWVDPVATMKLKVQ